MVSLLVCPKKLHNLIISVPDNFSDWDGSCNIQRMTRHSLPLTNLDKNFVFEREPNDISAQALTTPPVRVQGSISTSSDVDKYVISIQQSGMFL